MMPFLLFCFIGYRTSIIATITRIITVMAGSTSSLLYGGWMALAASSPAVSNTTSALTYRRLWMREIESCLIPIGSVMA